MNSDSPLFRFRLWYTALPRVLRALMTVQVGVFVALLVLSISRPVAGWLLQMLALWPPGGSATGVGAAAGGSFWPWQILTYTFVNPVGGFALISFLFGLFWLYWLGREYEEVYGSHRLFVVYAMTSVGGALLALLLNGPLASAAGAGWAFHHTVFVGLWGPVIGLLCAVAAHNPHREMGLFLIGVVKLKWIAIVFVALDLLLSRDVTHLGAALIGWGFGAAQRQNRDLAAWAAPLFRGRSAPSRPSPRPSRSEPARPVSRLEGLLGRRGDPGPQGPAAQRASGGDAPRRGGARDVDRILDKILEEGYDALTTEEKRILEDASRR